MPDTSTILFGVTVVLIVLGVWAVVEFAVTCRKTRRTVKKLSAKIIETIERAEPLIDKTEAVIDELDPAVKQLNTLLDRMGVTIDALTYDLLQAEEVIANLSRVTSASAQATDVISSSVSRATNVLASGLTGVIDRFARKRADERQSLPQDEYQSASHLPEGTESASGRVHPHEHTHGAHRMGGAHRASGAQRVNGVQRAHAQGAAGDASGDHAAHTSRQYYEYPSGYERDERARQGSKTQQDNSDNTRISTAQPDDARSSASTSSAAQSTDAQPSAARPADTAREGAAHKEAAYEGAAHEEPSAAKNPDTKPNQEA